MFQSFVPCSPINIATFTLLLAPFIADEEKKLNNIASARGQKKITIVDIKEKAFLDKVAKPYPHCVICKIKPMA